MSETMKAAIFVEPGKMTVEEVPKAMLEQDDDIVIRVVRTCVCGSDLWFFRGLSGQAAHSQVGHESIGVVEEVGAAVESVNRGIQICNSLWYKAPIWKVIWLAILYRLFCLPCS